MIKLNKYNSQKGQVLLLIVMMIAVVSTVVLTLSFRTQSDTQFTQLKTESNRTREAAEASIEVGFTLPDTDSIRQLNDPQLNLTNLQGVDLRRSRILISNNESAREFISPLLQRDDMFTFYVAPVSTITPFVFGQTVFNSPLDIYYGSENGTVTVCNNTTLEITAVGLNAATSTYYIINRYIADTGNYLTTNVNDIGSTTSGTVSGTSFRCRAQLPAQGTDTKVLFVRVIIPTPVAAGMPTSTRLGFSVTSQPASVTLPVQGRTIRSEVYSTAGVLTVVESNQSYPQIPSTFFVTSF